MNPFQWMSLVCLGSLLGVEAILFIRSRAHGRGVALRSLIWIAAICAIVYPRLASDVAQLVGIERGSNLVLYVLCLTFMVTTFFFYSLHVRLRGEITQLVRHIAITEARYGTESEQGANSQSHDR